MLRLLIVIAAYFQIYFNEQIYCTVLQYTLVPEVLATKERQKGTSGCISNANLTSMLSCLENLQIKAVLYFVTYLNFWVCHTTKIALFDCLLCLAA
jgi:FMN phosphatase YigB (HAD superfamily)